MIKYIITGGAGFIGSHLVEHFVKQKKKLSSLIIYQRVELKI